MVTQVQHPVGIAVHEFEGKPGPAQAAEDSLEVDHDGPLYIPENPGRHNREAAGIPGSRESRYADLSWSVTWAAASRAMGIW